MSTNIVFIGGASGSGKSTVVARFAAARGIALLQLDDLHRDLSTALGLDQTAVPATEAAAAYTLRALLHAGGTALVEGGWVQPEGAQLLTADFPTSFAAVFCGYPNADAKARLVDLKREDKHYLVQGKSGEEALAGIQRQIGDSRSYERRASERGFAFVDFSDFSSGSAQLEQLLSAQF